MNNKLFAISDTTAVGGLTLGLTQIYTILGIAMTAISLIVLIVNFCIRIYDRIKDGKLDKKEIEWTLNDVTELANKIVELEDQLKEAQAQLENKENTNDRN